MTSCISISWSRWKTQLTQLHSLQVSIVSVAVVLLWCCCGVVGVVSTKSITLAFAQQINVGGFGIYAKSLHGSESLWNRLYCKSYLGDMVYLHFSQKKGNFWGYLTVLDTPISEYPMNIPLSLLNPPLLGTLALFFFYLRAVQPCSSSCGAIGCGLIAV